MANKTITTVMPDTAATSQQLLVLDEMAAETEQLRIAQAAVMGSFDVVQSLGVIKASLFYTSVSEKLIAETAIKIRQGKKYKGLPYLDAEGNTKHVSVFEEFCEVFLGKTARRVQQLMSNYNLLGADLYEQAEKLGFQQRDYNALKALPADDRQLIAQAIESESLDKALDILQEMAARNQRDKDASAKTIQEQDDQLKDKDAVLSEKTKLLLKKSEELARLERVDRHDVERELMPGHYQLEAMHVFTSHIVNEIEASLRSHIAKLHTVTGMPLPKTVELSIAQCLGLIITAATGLAGDLRIEPVTDADKAANDPAKQDAEDFLAWRQQSEA